jgi:Protein of unknown function (DUF2442)
MNPRITFVEPLENFKLKLKFTDNSVREFDMKPYLSYPAFEDLAEVDLFKRATIFLGTVKWNEEIDMSPDTLFLESKLLA